MNQQQNNLNNGEAPEPFQVSIKDQVDHLSNRMLISALSGAFLGGSHAIFRGNPAPRASIQVSVSFALAATACFGIERGSYILLKKIDNSVKDENALYASHAAGGVLGGGLLGGIYQRRVFGGALLFTPIMMGAAYGEIQFRNWKHEKIKELMRKKHSNL